MQSTSCAARKNLPVTTLSGTSSLHSLRNVILAPSSSSINESSSEQKVVPPSVCLNPGYLEYSSKMLGFSFMSLNSVPITATSWSSPTSRILTTAESDSTLKLLHGIPIAVCCAQVEHDKFKTGWMFSSCAAHAGPSQLKALQIFSRCQHVDHRDIHRRQVL